MKKLFLLYFIYIISIWAYFLFFYPLETYSTSNYAAYSHAMFFSKFPLLWLFLYFFIKKQYAVKWADFAEKRLKQEWSRTFLFCGILVVGYQAVEIPFNLIWHELALEAGISRQNYGDWIYELAVSLLIQWVALSLVLYAARLLMQKFKYWWLFVWMGIVPVALFFIYIQPVLIDPLYADFNEINPGPMREAIEQMASETGLEEAELLQADMSAETTAFNAYVTGIWGNQRIVLWDTTLAGLEQEEVLFILAHEIGHYVYHHVPMGISGYLVMGLFLIWLVNFIYQRARDHSPESIYGKKPYDLRAVPVLLLIASLVLAAVQPVSLAVSRQMEEMADRYAIEHTEDPEAGIEAFIKMAGQSKADVDPALWIKLFRYSHPTIEERIGWIEREIEGLS